MEILKDFRGGVEVSNFGNLYKFGQPYPKRYRKKSGSVIKLDGKHYIIARLILELFEKTPLEGEWIVERLDGDVMNDSLDNLRAKPITREDPNKIVIPKKCTKYEFNHLETFKELKQNPLYEISDFGNVKLKGQTEHQCNRWNTANECSPYISIKSKNYNLAKLVLSNFLEEPVQKYITFKDLDKKNCRLDNLEWVDYQPLSQKKLERSPLEEGEIFKLSQSLDNRYEVSNKGNVRHVRGGLNRVLKTMPFGYKNCSVDLQGKKSTIIIHRAVLMTFNPVENMENLHVNHINHIPSDNRLENLEWSTPKENLYHQRKKVTYTSTDIVGISRSSDNEYRVKILVGKYKTFEEAEIAIKEAYLKLGIENKYLDRRVSDPKRNSK